MNILKTTDVYFNKVNAVVYELCLNKTIIKNPEGRKCISTDHLRIPFFALILIYTDNSKVNHSHLVTQNQMSRNSKCRK